MKLISDIVEFDDRIILSLSIGFIVRIDETNIIIYKDADDHLLNISMCTIDINDCTNSFK